MTSQTRESPIFLKSSHPPPLPFGNRHQLILYMERRHRPVMQSPPRTLFRALPLAVCIQTGHSSFHADLFLPSTPRDYTSTARLVPFRSSSPKSVSIPRYVFFNGQSCSSSLLSLHRTDKHREASRYGEDTAGKSSAGSKSGF